MRALHQQFAKVTVAPLGDAQVRILLTRLETRWLSQVPGVGTLTALTFVLTVNDPAPGGSDAGADAVRAALWSETGSLIRGTFRDNGNGMP